MLEDPEARQEVWSDIVWASSQEQAEAMCSNMAASSSDRDAVVRFDFIEQVSQRPNKAGKYPFRCWFTSFIRSEGNDNN